MMNPVLCVTREAIHKQVDEREAPYNGIYDFNLDLVGLNNYHFLSRKVVDGKSHIDLAIGKALPQVLPYVLVTCGNEVLTYSRAKGAEDRLHGALSCGFGGHVDLRDINPDKFSLQLAIIRELREELQIKDDAPCIFRAANKILLDSSNSVGSVHAGIVYVLDLSTKDMITPDLNEIHLPEWKLKSEVGQELDRYENWSQTLIKYIL